MQGAGWLGGEQGTAGEQEEIIALSVYLCHYCTFVNIVLLGPDTYILERGRLVLVSMEPGLIRVIDNSSRDTMLSCIICTQHTSAASPVTPRWLVTG